MTVGLESPPLPWPHSWPTWQRQAVETFHQTVTLNPWIPKRPPSFGPHPKQQRFLLHANTKEVLYGGAAGGGKTDALLSAAAQFVDVPGYSALILRSSLPDLKKADSMIPRSKEWWMDTDADWHTQDHQWTFPSGATITFGYLERDDDVYQYDSAAFQCIIIDELTQHTEWRYRFMFGRLRKPSYGPLSEVPLRMRAGTNPGGKGHEWVYKRFVNPSTRNPRTVFIPATIADNPSLDREEYLKSLAHLDPLTRKQREEGDWTAIAGGRFLAKWLRYYGRFGSGFKFGERIVTQQEIVLRFLTCDPAASVKETAKDDPDYTCISTWNLTKHGDLLWIACRRLRCEVPDIIPQLCSLYTAKSCTLAFLEGGGMQKGVVQLARRSTSPRMNIVELKPVTDKLVRATEFLNLAEGGRVWLPLEDTAFPREEVEGELLRFTGDPKQDGHDDIFDTASWAGQVAVKYARPRGVPYAI